MAHPAFEDRAVTLDGSPEQLAALAGVLASRTRLAVLQTLVRGPDPLHINALARRIGVDASPVRTHLELLVKAGLAEEVPGLGRERNFTTRLRNVRLVLEGIHRVAPARTGTPPKEVVKLQKKLASLERDVAKLVEKARTLQKQIEAAWAKAPAAAPAKG